MAEINPEHMRSVMAALDKSFNGDAKGPEKDIGIIVLTFPYGGDVPAILEGFVELDVEPALVAQAVAAMTLDHFGIEHELGGHGLTLAVCGVRP